MEKKGQERVDHHHENDFIDFLVAVGVSGVLLFAVFMMMTVAKFFL